MGNIPKHFTTERKASVMTITPDLAAEWLAFNTQNRNISDSNLIKAVNALEKGRYQFNGDAIRWSRDGRLLDAQHRLTACVETGLEFPSVVVWGIDPEAQITMDRGKRRSLTDHLRVQGEESTKELATVLNLCTRWYTYGHRFGLGGRGSVPFEDAFQYLLDNPNVRVAVEYVLGFKQREVRRVINPAHLAFMFWVFTNIDPNDAEGFVRKLIHGERSIDADPVWRLRVRLEDIREDRADNIGDVMALSCKAWNLYRAGASINQLRIRRGGVNPESYPEPR